MKQIQSYVKLTIGALISAFALRGFMIEADILDGGITGTSMLLSTLMHFKLSILLLLLNSIPLYLGYKNLGKRFLCKAIYSILLFTVTLGYLETIEINIVYEPMLCAIFGGILYGIGVGLVLREGACLDGTEVIGILISKNTPISVGQAVLGYNIVLYIIAGFMIKWDTALYSLLAYIITSTVIDKVVEGFNTKKSVMIITDQGDEIVKIITEHLGRTVTRMDGVGALSGIKDILYVVLTKLEVQDLRELLEDYQAFITVSDVEEVIGKHYKKKIKEEHLHEDILNEV